MREHTFCDFNLSYIDCSFLYEEVHEYISTFRIEDLSKSDIKKLTIHFILTRFISIRRLRTTSEKPVFFFVRKTVLKENKDNFFLSCFLNALRLIKGILPIPVVFIDNEEVLTTNSGELKEMCERLRGFYNRRNNGFKKLKKYLELEEYYELCDVLKDVRNIRVLVN